MNVKVGDLARVVAPYYTGGRGAFVTVTAFVPGNTEVFLHGRHFIPNGNPAWVVDGWVRALSLGVETLVGPQLVISDNCLRRVDPPAEGDTLPPVAVPKELEKV